jgi:hypothetical protein
MAETWCISFGLVILGVGGIFCWVYNLVVKDWIYRFRRFFNTKSFDRAV